MKIDYEKGKFVMDYLESIGFDWITIAEAISDKYIKKSYKIIMKNPGIGKYEFVKKLRIPYDEEEILLKKFLGRLLMPCYYIEEAFSDNYDKLLEIYKTRPDISREEFLEIMQFTGKYRDCFLSFRNDD